MARNTPHAPKMKPRAKSGPAIRPLHPHYARNVPTPKRGAGLTVNPIELERVLCRQSFYDFLLRFWPVVSPEELVPNWHIEYLCKELQSVAERVIGTVSPMEQRKAEIHRRSPKRQRIPKLHDLIINVPPGSTKSTIVSVMYPAWCWLHDPTIRLICGSYTDDLALYLAGQCQRVIGSEKYKNLFPEVVLAKNSGHLMETTAGGWRFSTSTGASCIGRHAHIQIIDDPINAQDAISEAKLRQANNWLDYTMPSRYVNKKIGVQILVMQRLAQTDPTGHKLEKQNGTPIKHICLPAVLTNKVKPRSLRSRYVDGLFDPVRLPREVLAAIENGDMGPFGYAGQYLEDPIPSGGGMFKTDMLQIVNAAPPMIRIIRSWDKAGSVGKGAWTVGVLMGMCRDKHFWILDIVRGQWDSSTRERIIKQTAERDGRKIPIVIEQEPGSGGKESAQSTVANLAGWRVRVDRPTGDKAMRADPVSVQVNSGNARCMARPWTPTLLGEMQHFPHSKFKDQIDTISQAFAYLAGKRLAVGALFRTGSRQAA